MTVYRGRVVITQGTLRIRGDVVTIFFDENNTISRLIAERVSDTDAEPQGESADLRAAGDLADFRQRPEENEEFHNAKADRMEWFAEKNKIVLLGNAESWQGDNRIQADRIVYDTLNGRVLADTRGADDGESEAAETKASQRVRITITPNNE
jgi:lipopolysaccharide export system protein LptA